MSRIRAGDLRRQRLPTSLANHSRSVRPEVSHASRRAVRRRHRRRLAAALIFLVAIVGAASGRLFVWPAQGMPARVDAIVVLGGPGDRLGKGLELAHQGRAPVLVISEGLLIPPRVCGPQGQALKVICFQPEPGHHAGGGRVRRPSRQTVPLAVHSAGDHTGSGHPRTHQVRALF